MKSLLAIFITLIISLAVIHGQESELKIEFIGIAENLGRNINSKDSELLPIISPDGNTLFFVKDSGSRKSGTWDQEIWFATRNLINLNNNSEWSQARSIGKPLNNEYPNAITSITPDGTTVLLLNSYNRDISNNRSGICFSKKGTSGWLRPELQYIPEYKNNGKSFGGACISNDSKAIIYSVLGDNTFGDMDLYVTLKNDDGNWTKPINLGNMINSSDVDFAPFLASDSKTLIFASFGHGGFGSSDIFISKRLDDSWTRWSKPVNLGSKINTDGFDAYLSIPASGDVAYFSRETENNESDIYRIKMKPLFKTIQVSGLVLDKKTRNAIQCKIEFERLSDGKNVGIAQTDPINGEYKIILPCGDKYNIRAEADCYLSQAEDFDLTNCIGYEEKNVNIYMVKTCTEDTIPTIKLSVFFDKDSSELKSESYPDLDYFAKEILKNPNWSIRVEGHTCDLGSISHNMKLSKDRSKAVMDYFIHKGIDPRRLSFKGYGPKRQICKEKDTLTGQISEECRQKNRRVEIEISSKKKK